MAILHTDLSSTAVWYSLLKVSLYRWRQGTFPHSTYHLQTAIWSQTTWGSLHFSWKVLSKVTKTRTRDRYRDNSCVNKTLCSLHSTNEDMHLILLRWYFMNQSSVVKWHQSQETGTCVDVILVQTDMRIVCISHHYHSVDNMKKYSCWEYIYMCSTLQVWIYLYWFSFPIYIQKTIMV